MPSRRTHRALLVGSLALLASGALAACTQEPSTQPEAESEVCQSVAAVKTAVADLAAIDATSTVAEAETARDALDTAIADLKASAQDLKEADAQALDDGAAAISAAIGDVSGSDTLAGAAAEIKASTQDLDAAVQEISDGYQCE
jgi:hypothetical protein